MAQPAFKIIPLKDMPQFADACAAWSYGEWSSQVSGRRLDSVIDRYRRTAQNDNQLPMTWVAVSDNRPAGMISLKNEDHPVRTDLYPWLASVFVHPEYRGRGLARALIETATAQARDVFNVTKIYLFTHTAPDLYEKCGFNRIGIVADPAGIRPEGDILMMKELA